MPEQDRFDDQGLAVFNLQQIQRFLEAMKKQQHSGLIKYKSSRRLLKEKGSKCRSENCLAERDLRCFMDKQA